MTQGVHFDNEDVKAAASRDPWELREDFVAEVDTDDIAEAAISYSLAAGEASSSEALAELATDQHVDAGEYEGMSLADAEERLARTQGDLATAELETTFEVLRKTVTAAEDAVQAVDDEIYAVGSLNTKIGEHRQNAVDELNLWFVELRSTVEGDTTPPYYIVKPPGTNAAGLPDNVDALEQHTGLWILPELVVTKIREHHLGKATTDANASADVIDETVEDYRAALTRYGGELVEAGYDIGASPLGVWATPEMAEYHAGEVAAAQADLHRNPADHEAVERVNNATAVIGSIVDSVFDENGELRLDEEGNAAHPLAGPQRRYLREFYSAIDAEHLAGVGHLEMSGAAAAQRNLGNGILAITNPFAGGINPNYRLNLPPSIREMMYDVEVGRGPAPLGYPGLAGYDPETGEIFLSGLYEFQGLGGLMERSTLTPGDQFALDLAASSLDVQEQFNSWVDNRERVYHVGDPAGEAMVAFDSDGNMLYLSDDELESLRGSDVGSSGALGAVSRNVGASQEFLGSAENLEKVVGIGWGGHDDGAADLLGAATERISGNSDQARNAAQIAADLFDMVGADAVTWRELVPKGSSMNEAMVDVAMQYVDAFVGGDEDVNYKEDREQYEFLVGRTGMNFLEFAALLDADATEDDYLTDPDMMAINLAAEQLYASGIGDAFERGDHYLAGAVQEKMGGLIGNIARYDMMAVANFAESEYEQAKLAYARRQVVTNAIFDLLVTNPAGRGIESLTQSIESKDLKTFTQDILKQVSAAGGAEGKKEYDAWMNDIFPEQPYSNATATLLKQLNDFGQNGRAGQSAIVMNELILRDGIDASRLAPGTLGSDGMVLPVSQLDTDQRAMLNQVAADARFGGETIAADGSWNYTKERLSDLAFEPPTARSEVDERLMERVRY